jgi:L-arabinokinase
LRNVPLLRYYISGHGLGHASRSCQVISALTARHPAVRCEVVSDAAPWFLAGNLPPGVAVASSTLDVGVRQIDSLVMCPEATIQACRQLQTEAPGLIAVEAERLLRDGTTLVVTDVAALPCAAAAAAGIPAVILSNFTWDWIYEEFLDDYPELAAIIAWQRDCYRQARLALRLPFHGPMPPQVEVVDLPLVTRHSTTPAEAVRSRLGLAKDQRLALLSFGGFGLQTASLDGLAQLTDWVFLAEQALADGHPHLRPLPCAVAYPDLVNAADVVITKPGYGIVAECLAHDTPVLFTSRGSFREESLLVAGLQRYGRGVAIDNEQLRRGDLQEALERLLLLPQPTEALATNGAEIAADRLARLLA